LPDAWIHNSTCEPRLRMVIARPHQ
jgi:hypothetical protein